MAVKDKETPAEVKTMLEEIRGFYQSGDLEKFMELLNEALNIVQSTNLELVDCLSNNISCFLYSFMPDLIEMAKESEVN